jgi:replication fork clamp-binding protein CrfC
MDKKEEMPPSLLKGLSFVTTAYNMRVRKDIIDNMKEELKKFILFEIEDIKEQLYKEIKEEIRQQVQKEIKEIKEQIQKEIKEQIQKEIKESCDCDYIQIEK